MSEHWKSVRNSFFAGLLVVVPAFGSILILLGFFNWLTNFLLPPSFRDAENVFIYRVGALFVFVVLVSAVGWITRLVVGKKLIALGEAAIKRIPILNKTYGFIKEISQTLLTDKKTIFTHVVLIEYPREGLFAIGFVTNDAGGEIQAKSREDLVNVFIPTTPNPTSGFLLFVPRHHMSILTMSVADGMKLIFSGGAFIPPYDQSKT